MDNLNQKQLDSLRNQLKGIVSGNAIACETEQAASEVGTRCGGHSSHTDNDGWV